MAIPTLSGGRWLGHLGEFKEAPLVLLRRFNEECGNIGFLQFPGERLLVVNTPELAGDLLVTEAAKFHKSRILRAALYPLTGEGLFTSEGELWRRQRKLMAPLFQPAHLAGYAAAMTSIAARCASEWPDGAELDIARETTRITMAIAGRTLFGADTLDESDELGDALTVLLAWAAESAASLSLGVKMALADALESRLPRVASALERPLLLPRRCKDALEVLERRVAKMIEDRHADSRGHDDLLSRLLAARDETGPMSDRQLRDEIVTLFVAGHETTATALGWSLYLLARHPDQYARVEREALTHAETRIGKHGLPDLPIALAVFSETLRMYPPVPVFERQAIEPVELAGHRLERGDYAAVFPWALHHRRELWPEPDRFDPSRFEGDAESARPRHAHLPFGAGPRVCLGAHFAMLEGALVLATIVRHARLELVDPTAEVTPDPSAATLRPLGGVKMRVMQRR